jgi:hypothetical protein
VPTTWGLSGGELVVGRYDCLIVNAYNVVRALSTLAALGELRMDDAQGFFPLMLPRSSSVAATP